MECYYLKNKQICPAIPTLGNHGEYERMVVDRRTQNERNRVGKFNEDNVGIHLPLQPIVLGGKQYFHNKNSNNVFDAKKNHIGTFDNQMRQIIINNDNRDEED
tara:strand:+ start:206 stop:514 length:309 start_codon:yes stop_codon:yes gene_type:complete